MEQLTKTKKLLAGLMLAVLSVFGVPYFAGATTLFDATINNDSLCGSGGCYGLTYELIITDAGDANASTYTGTIKITGTYTGALPFIAAVDFKPDGNTVTTANLTAAPGGIGGWFTAINAGQAVGDCVGSGQGFICSSDMDPNNFAPTGVNLNYQWDWTFSMSGPLNPGHLGACFDIATDQPGGPCVSIDTFTKVPEPSTLVLVGLGLLVLGGATRRVNRTK